jgi:hypothetical protein
MGRAIERIVIAGGGTAGWLSACRLASWARASKRQVDITLVESPDIPTVGVGEGTWPTMRETLAEIGIEEGEFLRSCEASFKQGSRFDGWRTGRDGDTYLHPFTPPPAVRDPRELIAAWRALGEQPFAATMSAQQAVANADLAPRQRAMPDYAGALNYAYHLDAGKFAELLRREAVGRLGVTHVRDEIIGVEAGPDNDIAAIRTRSGRRIAGDLFIDCSGHAALLIKGHCQSDWIDCSTYVFNDRAVVAQVAVEPGSPIASQTISTAHRAGWTWDIALPGRRGIGCVYSSSFMSDADAEQVLADYVATAIPGAGDVRPRRLSFPSGHRARFWDSNCVAIGLSSGFIEPLEASAIVLIELSLRMLIDNFPADRATMSLVAERFNSLFTTRWERIVEFLKLHYVLSQRTEPYWQAHRDPATVPGRLADLLRLWRHQPPSAYDLPLADEIFPAASYQYVFYGMGGDPPADLPAPGAEVMSQLEATGQRGRALVAALPTNRDYLDAVAGAAPRALEEHV